MTGLDRLLRWHSMRGGITTQYATATGNPVTFVTTLVRPLAICEAEFTPIQSGSGEPSSSNIRPISGLTGLTVYKSGADTNIYDEYPVTWQSALGTVYGGSIDLVSGTLTEKSTCINPADYEIKWDSQTSEYVCCYVSTGIHNSYDVHQTISNYFSATRSEYSSWNIGVARNGRFYFKIPKSELTEYSTTGCKTWFENNETQVVLYRETAVEHELTPQTIRALGGTNKIWSDGNGNISVKYIKKG